MSYLCITLLYIMKKNMTLTDCVKQLGREKLMRYATNLGVELNTEWSTSQMRQAYADYVLTNPKKLTMMLPIEEIKILKPSEKDKPGEPISLFNTPFAAGYRRVYWRVSITGIVSHANWPS